MRMVWVTKTSFVLFLDNIANMKYIFKAVLMLFLDKLSYCFWLVLICWLTLYENDESYELV